MKTRKEPANETYLAAELAQVMPPARAAITAQALCAIGRTYKRVAERLCGGEAEWGSWSDNVEAMQEKARKAQGRRIGMAASHVVGLPVKVYVSPGSGLILMCETKGVHKTALL